MAYTDSDIADALEVLAARQSDYRRYRRYAEGKSDLKFASDAFRSNFGGMFRRLSYNKCGRVIDAFSDRLIVQGWENEQGDSTESDPLEADALAIWTGNQLANRQSEVHAEALQEGDSYIIVWPDPETGRPLIAPNVAEQVVVLFNDDDPLQIDLAVKIWCVERGPDKGRWRVTVYDDERISRFISKGKSQQAPKRSTQLVSYDADGQPEIENLYGICPVIPFRNLPRTGQPGISELRDIISLQDGLNKSVADMLVGAEFQAFRQRWIVGLEVINDPVTGQPIKPFEPGADRVWAMPEGVTSVGEFDAADLGQYLDTQDSWEFKIARTSSIPVHWLTQTGTPPSGESLKTSESAFVSKLKKQQQAFGESWRQAMRLALIQAGADPNDAGRIAPIWAPAESRSEQEFWSVGLQRITAGIPPEQVWAEAGYSAAEIQDFRDIRKQQLDQQAERTRRMLDAGQLPGTEGM